MVQAIRYRENYIEVLSRYSHFTNYEKFINYLNKFQNPIKFYELMSSKNENIKDLTYVSDEHYREQEFDKFVSEFININEKEESIN